MRLLSAAATCPLTRCCPGTAKRSSAPFRDERSNTHWLTHMRTKMKRVRVQFTASESLNVNGTIEFRRSCRWYALLSRRRLYTKASFTRHGTDRTIGWPVTTAFMISRSFLRRDPSCSKAWTTYHGRPCASCFATPTAMDATRPLDFLACMNPTAPRQF